MAREMRRQIPRALSLFAAATLTACAVGPNFKRPAAPADTDYGTAATQTATDAPQHLMAGQDIPAEWWSVFQSSQLNELIAAALKNNADVHAAQAALRQSHELYAAQRASLLWPLVQGSFDADRSRYATNSITAPTTAPTAVYSLYTAELSVTYDLDVWGGSRRALEATRA